MAELGYFYAGERRKVTLTLDIPATAAPGLAEVARIPLTYVELPSLIQHVVSLPVTVNVVPLDVAQGRVPLAEVRRERLFREAQAAKRKADEALQRGDSQAAQDAILGAIAGPSAAPRDLLDSELQAEADWLAESREYLTRGRSLPQVAGQPSQTSDPTAHHGAAAASHPVTPGLAAAQDSGQHGGMFALPAAFAAVPGLFRCECCGGAYPAGSGTPA